MNEWIKLTDSWWSSTDWLRPGEEDAIGTLNNRDFEEGIKLTSLENEWIKLTWRRGLEEDPAAAGEERKRRGKRNREGKKKQSVKLIE